MKIALLLLSALSLLHRALAGNLASECTSSLPFQHVCAYGGCFLDINQHDMDILNCERKLKGYPRLTFFLDRPCPSYVIPKCSTFDYK